MGYTLCINILYSVSCILYPDPCFRSSLSPHLCILCHIVCIQYSIYPKQCILYLDWTMYLVSNHLYLVSRLDGTNVSGMDRESVSNLEANLRTDSRRRNRTRYLILNLKCYSINERSPKNTSTVPFNLWAQHYISPWSV